jgi:hypothetical protein
MLRKITASNQEGKLEAGSGSGSLEELGRQQRGGVFSDLDLLAGPVDTRAPLTWYRRRLGRASRITSPEKVNNNTKQPGDKREPETCVGPYSLLHVRRTFSIPNSTLARIGAFLGLPGSGARFYTASAEVNGFNFPEE